MLNKLTTTIRRNFQSVTYDLIVLFLIWGTSIGLLGREALPPNGAIFSLLVLYILAVVLGQLSTCLLKLPPLMGMLAAGLITSNAIGLKICPQMSSAIRTLALVVILLRAGLGLDTNKLKTMAGMAARLAIIPFIAESLAIAFSGHFLLSMPLPWSFLVAFILSAVSAAIVVPEMIHLQSKGIGTTSGLPTLVMAACSLDNVLAIVGIGVSIGLIFNSTTSSLGWQICKGPVEVISGLIFGLASGVYIGHAATLDVNAKSPFKATVLMVLFASFIVYISKAVKLDAVGPVAAIVLALVAGIRWRKGDSSDGLIRSVCMYLKSVWYALEHFLFALIGAEVTLSNLDGSVLFNGTLVLFIGLAVRFVAAFMSVSGSNYGHKEKLYIAISWLPKATVQAAFGPIALDMVHSMMIFDADTSTMAENVLTMAVLSILITAPLGAAAMFLLRTPLLGSGQSDIEHGTADERRPLSPTLVRIEEQASTI